MAGGLGKQQFASGLQCIVDVGKQSTGIWHLVNHSECQSEIDFAGEVVEPETITLGQASIDSVGETGFGRSFDESLEHFGLHLYG